jgi:hypothetical protein
MRTYSSCILFFILNFCALTGCSSKAAIEKRGNGKSYYLVNYSSSHTYQFTVLETRVENDSKKTMVTREITLGPKSEQFLGYQDIELPREYPVIPKRQLKTYELDAVSEKGERGWEGDRLRDTVIRGERLKYAYVTVMVRDLLHPNPARRLRYDYELKARKKMN